MIRRKNRVGVRRSPYPSIQKKGDTATTERMRSGDLVLSNHISWKMSQDIHIIHTLFFSSYNDTIPHWISRRISSSIPFIDHYFLFLFYLFDLDYVYPTQSQFLIPIIPISGVPSDRERFCFNSLGLNALSITNYIKNLKIRE